MRIQIFVALHVLAMVLIFKGTVWMATHMAAHPDASRVNPAPQASPQPKPPLDTAATPPAPLVLEAEVPWLQRSELEVSRPHQQELTRPLNP